MAAKMFILVFAAAIWQAQSQNCGQIDITNLFQNPGNSAPQNLYALTSSPIQLAIPIAGDGCISLNLETLGLPATVIPAPPASSRPVNLYLEESRDLLAEASICRPISNIPGPCGSQIRPQIYTVSEDICKPNICANERFNIPKPTLLLRPTLPNFGPICALEGSLDSTSTSAGLPAFTGSVSETNSCLGPLNPMTPKLPNPIFGMNRNTLNPYLGQSDLSTSAISDSCINIEPCRFVPDICRINYASPNVQTTATTETTTTVNKAGPFGGINGQATSTTTASNSEATSFVNVRPDSYTPGIFRGFNSQPGTVSAVATSEASATVSSPATYSSNIFGTNITPAQTSIATAESSAVTTSKVGPSRVLTPGTVSTVATSEAAASVGSPRTYSPNIFGTNITPAQTSVATAESSAVTTSKVGPSRVLTPGTVSTVATSEASASVSSPGIYSPNIFGIISPEAVCSTRIPHTYSPCILRGSNNFGAPSCASVSADASSCVNIGSSNEFTSNVAGFNNVLTPNTVSSVASSEATSIASTVSSNMSRLVNPSTTWNNMAKATATAESSSATNIVPLSSVSPNFYGGLPQTACLSKPVVGPAYIEPPIFFPNACSQTRFCNSIPPQTCGFDLTPYSIPYECADARFPTFGGAGPAYALGDSLSMAESSTGSVASSSAVAIDTSDDTAAISSSVATAEGVKSTSTTASSSSTSTVLDVNNPCTPCDDEVISSSTASSSSISVTEPVLSSVATCTSAATSSSSVSSVTCSPSILYQNPCNIELSPVTLEVQIPSSFATALSSNLCGYSSGLPTALSSCLPISTPPVVYELEIPSCIPAQLSCTLASSPVTGPVLCMNVEPVGLCSC